jgi:hypothetical protein
MHMVKEEMEMTIEMIESKIKEAVSKDVWEHGRFGLRITEKRSRTSTWNSKPTGMFVITVGFGRDRTAVHTKKDGSFDLNRVIALLNYQQERRFARIQRENLQGENTKIAQRVIQATVDKGIAIYVNNHGKIESDPTVIASSTRKGKLAVGFGLTDLNEAQATRAFELYAQMKKELEELA